MLSRLQHDLRAYWPRYLAHHTHRKNRALHDLGDLAVLTGALTFNPVLAAAGVGAGYSFAFAGHFLIEGRKPATLEHPVLAGLSNWRMFALGCTGGLEEELARYELESWLMHGVRETLFGSTLFCGTHSRIDRLGLSLGWRLGRA